MKKRGRSCSVFYKYLLSFLVMAFIPLGLAVSSFYWYNYQSFQKQTLALSQEKLRQTAELTDRLFTNQFLTASAIEADPALRPGSLSGDAYDRYQSLLLLRSYLGRSQQGEEAYFLLDSQGLVYSTSGTMRYDTLVDGVFLFPEEDRRKLGAILDQGGSRAALAARELKTSAGLTKPYLLFIHPVPAQTPYGHLIFFVDCLSVGDSLLEPFDDPGASLQILSPDGELLYARGDFLWDELPAGFFDGSVPALTSGGQSVVQYASDETGFVYRVACAAPGTGELDVQRNLLMLVSLLLLLLCLSLSAALAFFHYRPIRNLLRLIDRTGGKRDEMEELHEYFTNQKETAASATWKEPYLLQRVVELYLDGLIGEEELSRTAGEFCYPNQENRYFAVAVDLSRGSGGAAQSLYRQDILNLSVELEIRDEIRLCCIERVQNSAVVLIGCAKAPCDLNAVVPLIERGLEKIFSGAPGVRYGVGVSECVDGLSQIRGAYYEAAAAAEYLRHAGGKTTLYYRDLDGLLRQEEPVDAKAVFKLIQALRHGDLALSLQCFGEYYGQLTEQYQSFLLFRYFSYDFIRTLKESLEGELPAELTARLSSLVQETDRACFGDRMRELLEEICAQATASQKNRQEELAEQILRCIEKNAFDPSFSLEQLGDAFGLSPYYISRFVAEQTGEPMKDYLARLRIDEAKRLLRETDLPVYEIVSRIGYLDSSSFIRKFKKEAGMTPGEYRRQFAG